MDFNKAFSNNINKKDVEQITCYVGNNQKRFSELMKYVLGNDTQKARLAAWPMSYVVIDYQSLIRPYLKACVDKLYEKNVHPAIKRNILRFLQEIDIPAKLHAKTLNICFKIISATDEPIACKAFALSILENLTKIYPELQNELHLHIMQEMEKPSAAFASRAKKILKRLNK